MMEENYCDCLTRFDYTMLFRNFIHAVSSCEVTPGLSLTHISQDIHRRKLYNETRSQVSCWISRWSVLEGKVLGHVQF